MQTMKAKRQRNLNIYILVALLIVCLVVLGGWHWRQKRLNASRPLYAEAEVCKGAQEHPVQRAQEIVKSFNIRLAAEARQIEQDAEALDIVFYGDSIAETWRGTDHGLPCERCEGAAESFHRFFRSRYRAHVFAVGGDQVAHLHWRLLNGELMLQQPPRVAVLMIGTNDLGAAMPCCHDNITLAVQAVNGLLRRIEGVINLLRYHTPDSKIVVVGLPPRASWSVSSNKFEHPSQFTAPIEAVNHILRKVGTSGDFIHYAPCGDELLWDGEFAFNLQPDGLHPNVEGLEKMAACILSTVEGIIGRGTMTQSNMLSTNSLKRYYDMIART